MDILVEKQVDAARELLRSALDEIRRGDRPAEPKDTERPGPTADDEMFSDAESSMVVGFAEGPPGATVEVELLAGTTFPVRGLSVGVGCDPALRLVNSDETADLDKLFGLSNPQDIIRQRRGKHWQERFIQIAIFGFETFMGAADIEQDPETAVPPKEPGSGLDIIDVIIPHMTPVYRLQLKIPDDAEVGKEYPLSLEHTYGRRLGNSAPNPTNRPRISFIPHPNMFLTDHKVHRGGKKAEATASGWVKVV